MYFHKKKCTVANEPDSNEVVKDLLQQNRELQEIILKSNQSNNTYIVHSENKTQNNHVSMSVFLNEQCKDAINFEDFINQIQVTRDDILNNAEVLPHIEFATRH